MLNAASLSVRPLPGDFLPEDDESAAKPLRVEIGKATEDSGKNHPAVVVPRLPAGFTLPAPTLVESLSGKGRGDTKDHPLSHWFLNFSKADELLKVAAAHQQVATIGFK